MGLLAIFRHPYQDKFDQIGLRLAMVQMNTGDEHDDGTIIGAANAGLAGRNLIVDQLVEWRRHGMDPGEYVYIVQSYRRALVSLGIPTKLSKAMMRDVYECVARSLGTSL